MDNLERAPPEGGVAPKKSHVPMLAAMAEMGMAKELIAVLAKFGGIEIPTDLRRYLEGPIIVHGGGGWRDVIPKWMFPQIAAERVEIAMGESPYPIVGPTEIVAVMMPATFDAPLDRDMVELYCWAGARAAARHFKKPLEEYERMFVSDGDNGAVRQPSDKDVIQRGGRLWQEYLSLSEEIRRKVIAHQQGRERQRREAKPAAVEPPPAVMCEQLSFFDRLKARLAT
jgi:hypothetical protein